MRAGMFVTAMFRAHDNQSIASSFRPRRWFTCTTRTGSSCPSGDNQFPAQLRCSLGAQEKDGYQQVISGLKPGDQVVTNALQFSSAAEE